MTFSDEGKVIYSVPQGAALGPLCLNLFSTSKCNATSAIAADTILLGN